jgi:hypothetical protein
MGFSPIPPRPEPALLLDTIDVWAPRADAGLVIQEPPWADLLSGRDPEQLVRSETLWLPNYYRAKGLRILASIDPTNGLDRGSESPSLVATRHSLTEPAVRDLYRRYVGAFVSVVRPEALTLASETNLVRALAPGPVYAGVVAAANLAAEEARKRDPSLRLLITVQVEVANGLAGVGPGGIARDLADFPFVQALGLSSYPYLFGITEPEDLPLDYYSRLVVDARLPLYVIEGGWPSTSELGSSPEEQRRYIERHALILDTARAEAWFPFVFTDLDLASYPAGIEPFANLGLVDVDLKPKPALEAWDAVYARPFSPR